SQALGRVMGAAVATQRSLWLSLAKLSDREKAPLLDAHERVSPRQIQLRAQPPLLCGEVARMRSVTMGAKDDHKGLRAAIRPFPSAIQQSDTVCDAARTVSLPTGRNNLPA